MGRLGERRTKGMILWPLLLPSCHTAQTQRVPGVRLSVRASCMLSCSVTSDSLRPHGLEPARLVCPWDFPSKNTGVGCHFLLQGFFPTQGFNPWVGKIPWRRKWQLAPVFLPGKSHGPRSLEDYSPWGHQRVGHDIEIDQQHQRNIRS